MILWKFLFLVSSLSIAQTSVQDCNTYSTRVIKVQIPNENISYWGFYETIEMKPFEVGKLVYMKLEPEIKLKVEKVNTTSLKVSVDNHAGHDTVNYIEALQFIHADHCSNKRVSDQNEKICVTLRSEKQRDNFKFPSGTRETMMCLIESFGQKNQEILTNGSVYRVLSNEEVARNNNLSLIRVDFEPLRIGMYNSFDEVTKRDGTVLRRNNTFMIVPGFFDYWKSSKWNSILEHQMSINSFSLFNAFIYYPERGRMYPIEYTNTFGQYKLERKRNEDCELILVVQLNGGQPVWVHGQSFQTGGIYEGWTGKMNNSFFMIPFNSIQKQLEFEQFKFVIANTYKYSIEIRAVNEFPPGSLPIDLISDWTTTEPIYETSTYSSVDLSTTITPQPTANLPRDIPNGIETEITPLLDRNIDLYSGRTSLIQIFKWIKESDGTIVIKKVQLEPVEMRIPMGENEGVERGLAFVVKGVGNAFSVVLENKETGAVISRDATLLNNRLVVIPIGNDAQNTVDNVKFTVINKQTGDKIPYHQLVHFSKKSFLHV
uniref:Galectin n=2 Tax=Caenorhabditis tropicalis TaxID=1561998 RepID=A0A1I7U3K1_9PELO